MLLGHPEIEIVNYYNRAYIEIAKYTFFRLITLIFS